MRFVIVTGMSGAGKSTALKILEDAGYFCVDNLPIPLISKFAELTFHPSSEISRVALGVDIRSGQALSQIENVLYDITMKNYQYEILFLDASDEILIKRFKETRRAHPLTTRGRIDEGILKERNKLGFLKTRANYIIDTSLLLTKELRTELDKIFIQNKKYNNLFITLLSFGFKYGIPTDSDLVFDVRFLPNPYYVEDLKYQTGNEEEVRNFVMNSETSWIFLQKLLEMLVFLIPHYIEEGKNQLVISIGCTGGKHRSVTIANKLYEELSKNSEYGIKVEHRDITRDAGKRK